MQLNSESEEVRESRPEKQRVLAIVTAYNPHSALLRCLEALGEQTRLPDGIVVIDNSEPTSAELSTVRDEVKSRITHIKSGRNLGPAGGFALGLAIFLDEPAWTHAWVMDDDVIPECRCLEHLLQNSTNTRPGSLLLPTDVVEDSGEPMNAPGWIGCLLDRVALRLGGLPNAEYFWWGEDTEYLHRRLPLSGVQVERVPDAKVFLRFPRRTQVDPAWKYYYKVRNTTHYRLHVVHIGPRGLSLLTKYWVRHLRWAFQSPHRSAAVPLVLRGIIDGSIGRLGVRVTPPVDRAV